MKITESFAHRIGTVDRERGVIRGAKLLGTKSRNGRSYSEKAIAAAKDLYEGVPVNLDHDVKRADRRGIGEAIGYVRNVEYRPGEGLFGEIHYLRSHPMGEAFGESAERFPGHFGLSHMVDAELSDSKKVVESIRKVHSVDVVRSPATTRGLFESEVRTMLLSEIHQSLEATDPLYALLGEMAADPRFKDLHVELAEEATAAESIEASLRKVFEEIGNQPAKLDIDEVAEKVAERVAEKVAEKAAEQTQTRRMFKPYVESVGAGDASPFDRKSFRESLKPARY